jgi:hypothetical protein
MRSTKVNAAPNRTTAERAGLYAIANEICGDEATQEEALGMKPMTDPVVVYTPKPAMPDYVEHATNVPRSGLLSAEAVVMEFEQTAKEIEKLGQELQAQAAKASEAQTVLATALADLTKTAQAYRDEAARVFKEIEAVTTKASEASALAAELRDKIARDD